MNKVSMEKHVSETGLNKCQRFTSVRLLELTQLARVYGVFWKIILLWSPISFLPTERIRENC